MMQVWYSAQELADLRLPEMPESERAVRDLAKREGWIIQDRYNRWKPATDDSGAPLSRKRPGRGGGWEYHYTLLPRRAFERLVNTDLKKQVDAGDVGDAGQAAKAVEAAFKAGPDKTGPGDLSHLNQWQRDVMGARAALLGWLDEQAQATNKESAIDDLIRMSTSPDMPSLLHDLMVRANAKSGRSRSKPRATVSRRTLKNWFAARCKHGVRGLVPALSKEADFTVPEWGRAFLELYRRPNKPSLLSVVQDLGRSLPPECAVPSYYQASRFLGKLSPVALNKGRMGPQALKSMKAFTRRATDDLWPTAVYSADGHTFKATVEHPFHGQPFRPEITAVIDIHTRYVTGWSVGLSENSLGVLEALSGSIIATGDGRHRGLPALWYTDNGKGFRADLFEAEATGFYDRWGITAKNSLPYNSQARGVIERLNRTLWVPLARRLPTYVGRDADKEAVRKIRRITDKQLQAGRCAPFEITWDAFKTCVQDAIDDYNNRPHRALPRVRCPQTSRYRHLSPEEVWSRWLAQGNEAMLVREDEAADLVRPYERRKVARGEVRILNNIYFSFDLEPFHGDDVLVGFDIHDASKVWVRDFQMRLLAVATLDGNKRAYFDAGTVAEAMSFQERKALSRTKGRLRTNDNRRDEILAEARGAPLVIDHDDLDGTPALTMEQKQLAEVEYARIERPVVPLGRAGDRPCFGDDTSWARWLSENPEKATPQDIEQLRLKLRSGLFVMQMEFEGVVADTLKEIIADHRMAM